MATYIIPGQIFTAVNAATGTGTGASVPFVIAATQTGQPRLIAFQCAGTYSVCTVNLQSSFDGGNTWQTIGAAVDFYANPAGNLTTFFATAVIVAGPQYRLSLATFTGTSITVSLAVS